MGLPYISTISLPNMGFAEVAMEQPFACSSEIEGTRCDVDKFNIATQNKTWQRMNH